MRCPAARNEIAEAKELGADCRLAPIFACTNKLRTRSKQVRLERCPVAFGQLRFPDFLDDRSRSAHPSATSRPDRGPYRVRAASCRLVQPVESLHRTIADPQQYPPQRS